MFVKKAYFNLIWLMSSLMLMMACLKLDATGGPVYVFSILIYSLAIPLLFYRAKDMAPISPSVFWLGLIPLLFGTPLLENDYFRYLWEGKIFLLGHNPYTTPPVAINDVPFSAKEQIGFPRLTTVYPPLALIWFALGGIFDYPWGMIVLSMLNGLVLIALYQPLRFRTRPWHLLILIPWVQKEFLQAVHIDLLAAGFYFMWLINFQRISPIRQFSYINLGIWVKILPVLTLPFLLFQKKLRLFARILIIIFTLLPLPLAIYWLSDGALNQDGHYQFGRYWVWNPGFYSILVEFLNPLSARKLSLIGYIVYLIPVYAIFICLYRKNKNPQYAYFLFYYIFAGLMFFTPVYNAWYAIWFVLPALLLKLNTGVLYAALSVCGYIFYGAYDWVLYGNIVSHIWFPLSIVEGSSLLLKEHKT